jgi:CDP-6-deoxy-D-xylo-4-hexulose-3-dehydrase
MNKKSIKLIKSSFFNESIVKKDLIIFLSSAERLSMSEECLKFEQEFSIYQERKFTTLVNSGSSANLALLQALLNLGQINVNDTIAFSALTWSTNVMPIIQLGLIPYPVDIEIDTLNCSSRTFLEVLKKKPDIKAFFISNILGFCDDMDNIRQICEDRNILFFEDNCESFGSVYKGKKLGNHGLASTFSFFVGHHLSAIEGGAVCTDDEDLNDMLIMVRAHGWDRNLRSEKQKMLREVHDVDPFYDQYTFYDLGLNVRPTEITGFLGNQQLRYANEMIERRMKNFIAFDTQSRMNSHFVPLRTEHIDIISNFAYPVICKTKDLFEEYKVKFLRADVEIRPIVGGNMLKQPFFKKYSSVSISLPNATFVHDNGFYFPNNPELDDSEIEYLVNLLSG